MVSESGYRRYIDCAECLDAKLGATADAAASGATKCIDATSSSKIGYDNINTS